MWSKIRQTLAALKNQHVGWYTKEEYDLQRKRADAQAEVSLQLSEQYVYALGELEKYRSQAPSLKGPSKEEWAEALIIINHTVHVCSTDWHCKVIKDRARAFQDEWDKKRIPPGKPTFPKGDNACPGDTCTHFDPKLSHMRTLKDVNIISCDKASLDGRDLPNEHFHEFCDECYRREVQGIK